MGYVYGFLRIHYTPAMTGAAATRQGAANQEASLRACLRSRILALQTPKFYFAGSKKSRKSGFLRSIDRKNQHFKQALRSVR
jgi:hypothetical protein